MNWEFYLLLEGHCLFLDSDSEETLCSAPEMLIFRPDHLHGWKAVDSSWRVATFHFSPVPLVFENWMDKRESVRITLDKSSHQICATLAEESWQHYNSPVLSSAVVFQKVLCGLCQVAMESDPKALEPTLETANAMKVKSALNWFETHIKENPTVEAVSNSIHMSASNLRRLFNEVLGQTPKQAFTQIKLNHCMELMAGSDLTLEAIARECGFADANEICRTFRRLGKEPPTKWRKHILSSNNDLESLRSQIKAPFRA